MGGRRSLQGEAAAPGQPSAVLLYIVRRLVNVVVMLLVVSMITFGIFFMVPKLTGTDPVYLYVGKNATPAAVEGLRVKLGLDKPLYEQYGLYLKGIVVGRDYPTGTGVEHCPAPCLGLSVQNEDPVWGDLTSDLPITASLAAGASILWLILGVGTGALSALRKRSIGDRVTMVTALAGVSLPIYFTGLLSIYLFCYTLNWLPDPSYVPLTQDPVGWAQNLILPWITLAFLYAATYARLTRATMLDVLGEDYIRTARAKGLPERIVIGKHAMRSTMTPILTVFGMDLGGLIGGAVLTETVFNLHGLGNAALQGIQKNDLPMIMGVTLFAAFFIVMANLIVDLLYAAVDPRVRLA